MQKIQDSNEYKERKLKTITFEECSHIAGGYGQISSGFWGWLVGSAMDTTINGIVNYYNAPKSPTPATVDELGNPISTSSWESTNDGTSDGGRSEG